jgi:hypothetical protein
MQNWLSCGIVVKIVLTFFVNHKDAEGVPLGS